MLLKDFFQMFPDENSCENYLKGVREEVGVDALSVEQPSTNGYMEGDLFSARPVATEFP